jgi:hypothetical protein
MENRPRREPRDERIAHAATSVNAAMARVGQAQEALRETTERLALARRALKNATMRGAHDVPRDDAAERNRCEEDDSAAA